MNTQMAEPNTKEQNMEGQTVIAGNALNVGEETIVSQTSVTLTKPHKKGVIGIFDNLKGLVTFLALIVSIAALVSTYNLTKSSIEVNKEGQTLNYMPYFDVVATKYKSKMEAVQKVIDLSDITKAYPMSYSFISRVNEESTGTPTIALRNIGKGYAYNVSVEWEEEQFFSQYLNHIISSEYLSLAKSKYTNEENEMVIEYTFRPRGAFECVDEIDPVRFIKTSNLQTACIESDEQYRGVNVPEWYFQFLEMYSKVLAVSLVDNDRIPESMLSADNIPMLTGTISYNDLAHRDQEARVYKQEFYVKPSYDMEVLVDDLDALADDMKEPVDDVEERVDGKSVQLYLTLEATTRQL